MCVYIFWIFQYTLEGERINNFGIAATAVLLKKISIYVFTGKVVCKYLELVDGICVAFWLGNISTWVTSKVNLLMNMTVTYLHVCKSNRIFKPLTRSCKVPLQKFIGFHSFFLDSMKLFY